MYNKEIGDKLQFFINKSVTTLYTMIYGFSSMAISECTNGLVATGLLTLLLLPAQYYIPGLYPGPDAQKPEPRPPVRALPASTVQTWFLPELPALDLFLTVSLFPLAVMTYLFDWIQRKLMERRLQKLNAYLCECVERLRVWDARQQQLEATLRMVQNATSEYNLLLYLLLRFHRSAPRPRAGSKRADYDLPAPERRYEPGLL